MVLNRLYTDVPLYIEGRERTLLRGVMHTFMVPVVLLWGLVTCWNYPLEWKPVALFAVSNALCWAGSSYYHRYPHKTAEDEIKAQYLDHAFIYVANSSYSLSLLLLLMPNPYPIVFTTWVLVGYFIYLLYAFEMRCIDVQIMNVIFTVFSEFTMDRALLAQITTSEMLMFSVSFLVQVMACLFFVSYWPLKNNKIFGFHEVFHFLNVAGACLFMGTLNSIISRKYAEL